MLYIHTTSYTREKSCFIIISVTLRILSYNIHVRSRALVVFVSCSCVAEKVTFSKVSGSYDRYGSSLDKNGCHMMAMSSCVSEEGMRGWGNGGGGASRGKPSGVSCSVISARVCTRVEKKNNGAWGWLVSDGLTWLLIRREPPSPHPFPIGHRGRRFKPRPWVERARNKGGTLSIPTGLNYYAHQRHMSRARNDDICLPRAAQWNNNNNNNTYIILGTKKPYRVENNQNGTYL